SSSTYWGTDKYDQSFFVQLDRNNEIYLFGQTEGKMPVQAAAYSNPNSSQFITKLNNSLTKIGFSTVVGNGQVFPNISPTAFLVDLCGNIYVAGWAAGFKKGKGTNGTDIPLTNMPITAGSLDGTTSGFDFYLMVLGANANSLVYGMYWGGDKSQEHVHGGTSRFDKKGIVYQSLCTGCGGNDDYPVMPPGTWPNKGLDSINGSTNCNNAVFKIDFQPKPIKAQFVVDSAKGCAPFKVKFANQSTSWTDYVWDFGNGDTTSVIPSPTHVYTVPGTYKVKLLTVNKFCNTIDSTFLTITVYPSINADFDLVNIKCTDSVTFTDKSFANPVSWLWNFDDGTSSTLQNPVHVYKTTGSYTAQLTVTTVNGCKDTVQVSFDNRYTISVNKDTLICEGNSTQLLANGGYSYKWLPTTGLNDPNIANPLASPAKTTTYTVHINYVNAMGDSCSKDLTTTVNVFDKNSITLKATADINVVVKGESTTLHATINPVFSVKWSPEADVKDPNALNTLVTPQTTTTYTVSIIAGSCSRSDTVTIYVLPNDCETDDIFVPNTFTPNEDGQNDVLYARSNVVSSIYFAVYDRWGELMFETTDLKKGWDGVYKGMKADPAVFAWYVKGKCYNGKEFFKKGNVTLIR
ncbi:MAG TPA: PKD domain-containing protein, partial [Bacteroidia bacterium]|nr:PKD domain-containing protein [Bacteroidia bacterium]